MSTVRTPQNRVNDNEDVNLDKTRRATSFEMMPETPLGDIEDQPLDGTIRAPKMPNMPKIDVIPSAKPKDVASSSSAKPRIDVMPKIQVVSKIEVVKKPKAPNAEPKTPAEPKVEVKPTIDVVPSAEPKVEARPTIDVVSKAEPAPIVDATPKVEPKVEVKPTIDVVPSAEPKMDAKPLDGTVRAPGIDQPIMAEPVEPVGPMSTTAPSAPKAPSLDGTIRGAQMPMDVPAPQPIPSAAPSPSAGGTTRGVQPQVQPQIRPNVNISIVSSASSTQRANKLKQQRAEIDDSIFVLRGQNYKRKQVLSENTGEAQVFLVEKDKQEYVLKIYYPNFDVNRKILQTVLNFDFEMVVKVYDFGKTYVDGKHRYYELMEYLHGGSMAEYKLDGDMDKFRRIALQAAAALAYCHQCRILHKDIKPGNFFFRDKEHTELVLGDFGISSMIEDDGKAHKTTQARTPIYAAPEMYSDVIDGVVEISPKADFYSLGISLMTLWLGESPMSTNERVMMRQKNEGRIPHMNELPERIKLLVMGLTVVNPINRWGYDQVEQWFLGESPKVDLSSPFLKYKSFIVDPERNLVADNIHELIPMLLTNERLSIGYLYNGRITQWLEACGNSKLSTIVKDIITKKYPIDQKAGLMASVYAMEPTYPYKDLRGGLCDDIHSVCISLLSDQDEYAMALNNPNDNFYLYIETHTSCDVDRLRSYFQGIDRTSKEQVRVAIMKIVLEVDPEIPFMTKHPSSTINEIVSAFSNADITEDEWHSLTDGRLLAWMYSHEDPMACESLRIMLHGHEYSSNLAYKVLYNLNRESAYDLANAFTPMQVGELLNERLHKAQNLSDKEFEEEMRDFLELDGRFAYYAQLHGWNEMYTEHNRCFDFKSEENKERLGAYDAKTAVYRFCRILGVTPTYIMPDGIEYADGRNLQMGKKIQQFRNEIRSGSLAQWMSVFYHEDPNVDFSQEYSYEHAIEDWLMAMGKIDPAQRYYKRFVDARDETMKRVKHVKDSWQRAKAKENIWRMVFYGLSGVWMIFVLIFGVTNPEYILSHTFISIGLPLGGMTGVIVATRSFFKGYDFLFSFFWGLVGAFTCFIPIIILKYIGASHPTLFNIAVIVITLIYMLVCHLTDFRGDEKADSRLISEVLENDVKSNLIEPLFYTFKARSYKFKGSKFGLLNDVTDQVRSISGESVLHYVLWSLLMLVFVISFVVFSPKMLNIANPNSHMKEAPANIIKKIDRDA